MKRKPITDGMKWRALLYRFDIRCRLCSQMLGTWDDIEWDHITALALGGEHDYVNIAPAHRDCHAEKTRGTGATSAGSDIHKIAKANRIVRTGKMEVKKHAIFRGDHEWDSSKPKRKFPKSKKLRSRNTFQKRTQKNAAA